MEIEEIEQEETEETTDYKQLYEEQQAETMTEREKREKAEARFKKTAKELNEIKGRTSTGDIDIGQVVEKRISEELYYLNNPVAKEFKQDIEALKKTNNLSTEDAFTLYLAKNKPDLLGKQQSTGVEWVANTVEPAKAYSDMSYEELVAMRKGG